MAVNGARLWVEDTGGPGEVVAWSHGLLWSTRMFDPQVAALRDGYRCVAWDHRGQGRSDDDPARCISIETVTADAIALLEALGVGPVHLCGLSMGGFVAMRIAARRPDLVRSLVLLETSAEPEPRANVPRYRLLSAIARWASLRLVARPVLKIMFGRTFLTDPAREADRATWRAHLLANRRTIVRAVAGVIEREGVTAELPRITVPTLVIVGDEDVATVPAKAEAIAAAIPSARLVTIPGAGHTSTIEQPERVTAAIRAFLDGLPRPERAHGATDSCA